MIQRILGTGLTVSNLEQAIDFYSTVLPFEFDGTETRVTSQWGALAGEAQGEARVATMRLGEQYIELIEAPADGRPIPHDSRSNDLWFQHVAIVVRDMDAAYARLREHRVQHVSSMPQTLPDYIPAAAGVKAFYFRDPDGHNLELIYFPEGKGNPVWQGQDSLFLGIDHTAIGIASTPRSLEFYRDKLGLTVAGDSENYGPEQEHLNMVFGAHLQITGLSAPQGGIGLEFLDYLSPPGGRPMPPDTRLNDLWYWETVMQTDDVDVLAAAVPNAVISVIDDASIKTALIRDPDGHILRVQQI